MKKLSIWNLGSAKEAEVKLGHKMKNKDVYVVVIVYLLGIANDMADIRTIGVYKNYDKAVEAAKNTLKTEEDSLLEDNYDVDIANYENEWWIYESGEVYAIVIINKTVIK